MGYPPQTQVLEPTAGFTSVYLPVCLIAAAVIASPWILYQIWRFVSVGLYRHERRAVHILAPFSTVMTALAVGFTYYILLPVSLLFFLAFARTYPTVELKEPGPIMSQLMRAYAVSPRVAEGPEPGASPDAAGAPDLPLFPVLLDDPADPPEGGMWFNRRDGKLKIALADQVRVIGLQSNRLVSPQHDLGQYVRFAAMMMLGVCLAFQLPVIMLVAGSTGLFDPRGIAKLRKYALFGAFAIGAVLTPADLFSMFVLAVPLYTLFEFGLLLMNLTQRRRDRTPPPAEL